MALLNGTFDASGVEPAAPMELLPPGRYVAQIVQSEMQPTKAGDGQMLWLEFEILDGPLRGRKIWDRLNLAHRNQQTVEIAQRQLSAICHAVGQIQVSDSEQLHFRPVLVTLAVEPDSRDAHLPVEQRRKQNKVKGYSPAGGVAAPPRPAPTAPVQQFASPPQQQHPQQQPATPPQAPRQPAPNAALPPWRRNG